MKGDTMSEVMFDEGKKKGVDRGDVATLIRHGLAEGTYLKSKGFGVDMKQWFDWFNQFGPHGIAVATTIFASLQGGKTDPVNPEAPAEAAPPQKKPVQQKAPPPPA